MLGVPVATPSVWTGNPGPAPAPMVACPTRFGTPKLVVPLPPYVVPTRLNTAEFPVIGSNWPFAYTLPEGA